MKIQTILNLSMRSCVKIYKKNKIQYIYAFQFEKFLKDRNKYEMDIVSVDV